MSTAPHIPSPFAVLPEPGPPQRFHIHPDVLAAHVARQREALRELADARDTEARLRREALDALATGDTWGAIHLQIPLRAAAGEVARLEAAIASRAECLARHGVEIIDCKENR